MLGAFPVAGANSIMSYEGVEGGSYKEEGGVSSQTQAQQIYKAG